MQAPKIKAIVWIPLIVAISVVLGMIIGTLYISNKIGKIGINNDRKINAILNIINQNYVDTIEMNDLVEMSIPKILSNLDPHSSYIPAKDLDEVNSELEGSFSGIGISFFNMNDTITCIEILSGGPAEKAGMLNGDRIVSVNDSTLIGASNEDVLKRLRGPKGSKVKLGIRRTGSKKTYFYNLTRDDIPVSSIDAAYIIDKGIGYIRVNKFGQTTYDDFLQKLLDLRNDGAKKYIIDLRGNGGGLMESAILMANEFLDSNKLIVFTKARERKNSQEIWSDGNGTFRNEELVVLIDPYSASASEIFAGAIQDNDRGLIVGQRSFGKGLIQQQIELGDKSAIRLTIGRYYTPSGRCIQKDFVRGQEMQYMTEVYDRYSNGELYSRDSIKIDKNKIFETVNGRKVYGGGGIIPDIFVPTDTTGITAYYSQVANAGLIQQFVNNYTDKHRDALNKAKSVDEILRMLPSDEQLLQEFVQYAAANGVPARWYYVNMSRKLIVQPIKGLIARYVLGLNAYYIIHNKTDNTVRQAINALKANKAKVPISADIK